MAEIVKNLVSTIIPVYNRPELLIEAVESVLAQTHRPIEIIISDDGSTDETPNVAQQLAAENPNEVRFINNDKEGPGPAREAGRLIARGEFIQYLDSDDVIWPKKFEMQVAALREHPECGAAYGRSRLITTEGEVLVDPYKWTGKRLLTLFPWLLVDRWWCTHTPLYRKSVCDAVGAWTNLRWSQDWEYDGRVGALQTKLAYCDERVSDHRQHAGERQTSWANWLKPSRAKERKRFMGMLFSHAKRAGVTPDNPEMQHFSRWLFLTARQCGAAGLMEDSRECFEWAREAAGPVRQNGRDFRTYKIITNALGWNLTGKYFCMLDRVLRRKPSSATMKQSWMQGK
jgi:glycosyltransferase involved in cell wall biosynthesis